MLVAGIQPSLSTQFFRQNHGIQKWIHRQAFIELLPDLLNAPENKKARDINRGPW